MDRKDTGKLSRINRYNGTNASIGRSSFVFLMLRGFLGSLTTKPARRFLRESISLHAFFQSHELKMPAVTTILENVNLVSHATRELIVEKKIAWVLKEELDDFQRLRIAGTSGSAECMSRCIKLLRKKAFRIRSSEKISEKMNKKWNKHCGSFDGSIVHGMCYGVRDRMPRR